jgi:prepilin-type N-terminal cleavage/methylation domain-containing protein
MKKAFTLIELLVVLALVSLLISIVGPSGKRMYSKFSKRLDKIEEVGKLHDKYFINFLQDKEYFEYNKSRERL